MVTFTSQSATMGNDINRLIAEWKSGNQGAATTIYRRYLHRVERVVRNHLNARFHHRVDADDIVQTVYMNVFEQLRGKDVWFEDNLRFHQWISSVARNRCIKQVKYHTAARRSIDRDDSQPCETIADNASRLRNSNPEDIVARKDEFHHIATTLDIRCQRIVELMVRGETQTEIASRLNVTDRTIRRSMPMIREALKALL